MKKEEPAEEGTENEQLAFNTIYLSPGKVLRNGRESLWVSIWPTRMKEVMKEAL
jgi:hypothetical protein